MRDWLRCQVLPGMFSSEYAVVYRGVGQPQSFFVPKEDVRVENDGSSGSVRVTVYSRGNERYAQLPTEYGDIVQVDPADLVAA